MVCCFLTRQISVAIADDGVVVWEVARRMDLKLAIALGTVSIVHFS